MLREHHPTYLRAIAISRAYRVGYQPPHLRKAQHQLSFKLCVFILLENMLSFFLCTLLFYCVTTFPAGAPFLPENDGGLLAGPSGPPDLALALNISRPLGNFSSSLSKTVKVGCSAHLYGRNPKVKSCRDLFGYLRPDSNQYTFSQRDSGIPQDVGLPIRTYSSRFLALQITLRKGAYRLTRAR